MTQRSIDNERGRPFLVELMLGLLDKAGAVLFCLFVSAFLTLPVYAFALWLGFEAPLPAIYALLAGIPIFGVSWIVVMILTSRAEKRAPK